MLKYISNHIFVCSGVHWTGFLISAFMHTYLYLRVYICTYGMYICTCKIYPFLAVLHLIIYSIPNKCVYVNNDNFVK